MAGEKVNTISPTKGFNVKIMERECLKFTFWDLGGQKSIRDLWENYFDNNDAIIYVIDSSDQYRLDETGAELRELLDVVFNKVGG